MKEESYYPPKPLPTHDAVGEYNSTKGSKKEINWYLLTKILLVVMTIFCGGLLYLTYHGYTTDDVNMTCPEITIPTCPACPENVCNPVTNCGDVNFPDTIGVNILNNTNSST